MNILFRNRTITVVILVVLTIVTMSMLEGCSKAGADEGHALHIAESAKVLDDGVRIEFPADAAGLQRFTTVRVSSSKATVTVNAPARIVASITGEGAIGIGSKSILFDNNDATTLFTQYRQAKASVALTQNNVKRTQEMFANQGATAKDMNQAETDAATARATLSDTEGRLRAAGFNPAQLESAPSGTVWLLCDVPESQLHEVQKGEDVEVKMSSFTDKTFVGKADAIGDIIDPNTRTVKVRVTLRNPKSKLLPGMFAKVNFADPQSNVIVLPVTAVMTVEGKDYVFIQTAPTTFERRPVTVASSTSTQAIITNGIHGGENVVVNGAILLKGLSFGF